MAAIDDDSRGWVRLDYRAADGLPLAGRKYGWEHRDRTPLICLAGLTRNSADFHRLAVHLSHSAAKPRRVLALDYRGRGMSAWDRDWRNYDVMVEADDVLSGACAAGIGEAAIIGTSRGGLIALVLAAMRPGFVKAAILNDIGPQIEARGLLRIRSYLGRTPDFDNWTEAANALRAIGQSQFTGWDASMWERQARLIYEEKAGRIVRRYDPALMRTLAAINLDNPLPSLWPQFAALHGVPVMAIRGGNSELLSPQTLERMARAHPGLKAVTIADQGHAPDPGSADLPGLIASFLIQADRARRKPA